MKIISTVLLATGILASTFASAGPISTATLTGYIQNGTITNDALSGSAIESIVYDLGVADAGIATWDTLTDGGSASNFLSDPKYFQTVTWGGLNVSSGSSFTFGGLDIDLITSISPLSVTGGILDSVGTSLVNASLRIFWSDGSFGSVALDQQAWASTQNLTIDGASPTSVSEPATLALLGLGLAGIGFSRKKK